MAAGHALDTLAAIIGDFERLSATVATRFAEAIVVETGATIPVTSPDQVAITGLAPNGVVVAGHVVGGTSTRTGIVIELRGTDAILELTAARGLAAAPLALGLITDDEVVDIDTPRDDAMASVGKLYADLATAVRTGRPRGPDFTHAVRRHQLLDAINASSRERRHIDIPAPSGATRRR